MEHLPVIPGISLISKLGDGGSSTVWKAWDEVRGWTVAVKILNEEFAADGDELGLFRNEEAFLREMSHPGLVKAYDLVHADGKWCFVMEYVDGYSFSDLLRRKQHVKEADCLLICESVASALDYVWNEHGIVHCDIKPENIMINTEGVIKLLDLGISHRFENLEGPKDVPDHVLGTPAYISPEQIYGDVELDCRADIYSLGASLYHLATGRILFPGLDNENMMRAHCDPARQALDPRTFRPEISEGFSQLLESMLVKERDYRVSSWSDVFEMCQEIEGGTNFKPRDTTDASSSIRLIS